MRHTTWLFSIIRMLARLLDLIVCLPLKNGCRKMSSERCVRNRLVRLLQAIVMPVSTGPCRLTRLRKYWPIARIF